jgi:hypothetical protein
VDIGADETPYSGDDCDSNGVSDACEILLGTSEDCQENQVPDVCEYVSVDCNGNGISDDCDTAWVAGSILQWAESELEGRGTLPDVPHRLGR